MPGSPFEPNLSFNHATAKVIWAQEHIKQLQAIYNHVVEQHPRTVSIRVEDDGSWGIHVKPTQPIPANIPLLAGDAIHNLRAALDYCWMGLLRSVSDNPRKKTLPRGNGRNELEGTLRKAALEKDIPGVDDFVLNRLKPYREDGNQILWLAAQFDNWNKHNLLIATLGASLIRDARISSQSGSIRNLHLSNCTVISNKANTPFAFGLPAGDILKFDSEPDVVVDVIVGLGEPSHEWSVIQLTVAILHETAEAIQLFRTAFGTVTAE